MRDRWVALYILLVIAQVPLYFWLGEGPLKFEFAAKDAENRIRDYQGRPEEQEVVQQALEYAYTMLEAMGDDTSRLGRVKLNEGILEWKYGKPEKAIKALQESYEVFVEKHGSDSFHAAAVDARLGELYYLQRRYNDALVSLERSMGPIRDYMGPRHSFVVRMAFRRVSTLVALGRMGQAEELAREYLGALKLVAGEQDSFFLSATGGSLDVLFRSGRFQKPPGEFETWKSYLGSFEIKPGDVVVPVKNSDSF